MELEATITERRRQTRGSIYRYIYDETGFCTKQSVATALKLSLPTVYQNLNELVDAGLAEYSGEQRSTGGRKAMGLRIVPGARFAVGVSITDDRLKLTAADLRLKETAYRRVSHPPVKEMENFGAFMAGELEKFLDDYALDRRKLLGVGIALPATFSRDTGLITLAPSLDLRESAMRQLVGDLPYPTYLENDATSAGYAEWFSGAKQRDMAYLLLETGIGGAVLVNGGEHHGDNHRSGEFGHMCVEPGGLTCRCGRRGCLEAYCSAGRIYRELGMSAEEFFSGVEKGSDECCALWDNMLRRLAVGVNNIRMALDCDVVLGGFLAQFMEPYMPRLKGYAAELNPFESDAEYLRLGTLREHTVPLGVALHFIREFVENV